ncbi:MAG: hypothetical protein AAFO15_01950 [Pseudomonadota bacterium]
MLKIFEDITSWLYLFIKMFLVFFLISGILILSFDDTGKCRNPKGEIIYGADQIGSNLVIDSSNVNEWIKISAIGDGNLKMQFNGIISTDKSYIYGNSDDLPLSNILNPDDSNNLLQDKRGLLLGPRGVILKNGSIPLKVQITEFDILHIGVNHGMFSSRVNLRDLQGNNIKTDCSSGKLSYSPICGHYSPWSGMAIIKGACRNRQIWSVDETINTPRPFSAYDVTRIRGNYQICQEIVNGSFNLDFDDFKTWLYPFSAVRMQLFQNGKSITPFIYLSDFSKITTEGIDLVQFSIKDLLNKIPQVRVDFANGGDVLLEISLFQLPGYAAVGGAYIYLFKTANTVINGRGAKVWIGYGDNYIANAQLVDVNQYGEMVLPSNIRNSNEKIWIKMEVEKPENLIGEMKLMYSNDNVDNSDNIDNVRELKSTFVDWFLNPIIDSTRDTVHHFLSSNVCNANFCSDWVRFCHVLLLISSVIYILLGLLHSDFNIYNSIVFTLKIIIVVIVFSPSFVVIVDILRDGILHFIGGIFEVLFNVRYNENSLLSTVLAPGIVFFDQIPHLLGKAVAYISAFPIGILLLIIIMFSLFALLLTFIDVIITVVLAYINNGNNIKANSI